MGHFVDEREGRAEWFAELYEIVNAVTPGVDGVTISDWRAITYYWVGVTMQMVQAKKAAEAAAAEAQAAAQQWKKS